jgi:hypothetical protein
VVNANLLGAALNRVMYVKKPGGQHMLAPRFFLIGKRLFQENVSLPDYLCRFAQRQPLIGKPGVADHHGAKAVICLGKG